MNTDFLHFEKCWFCNNRIGNDSYAFQRNLYNEVQRTNILIYSSVKFIYKEIAIPRCKECFDIHVQASNMFWLVLFCIILIGFVLRFNLIESNWCVVISIITGYLIAKILRRSYIILKDIKFFSNSEISGYPIIHDYLNDGWTFSKPKV